MFYWHDHKSLEGKHAILSASQGGWINANDESLMHRTRSFYIADAGTVLHELASKLIKSKLRITDDGVTLIKYELTNNFIPYRIFKDIDIIARTIKAFVNDAIGFGMESERVLYVSPVCFGTTDAISYDEIKKILRIHDLKNGEKKVTDFRQLILYSAEFCIEYKVDPRELTEIELRYYQYDEITAVNSKQTPGLVDDICNVINLIKTKSTFVESYLARGM
jgi:hypothetical protein